MGYLSGMTDPLGFARESKQEADAARAWADKAAERAKEKQVRSHQRVSRSRDLIGTYAVEQLKGWRRRRLRLPR